MARHVGTGKESTYGTAATITDFTEAISESLKLDREFEEISTVRFNAPRGVNELKSMVSGDITVAGNYQDLGQLIKHYLGSNDVSGAGPYVHTFPAAAGTSGRSGLSLTVEVSRGSTALTSRYAGCKVVGWTCNGSTTQSPQHTFSFIGKSEGTGSATTYVDPGFDAQLIGDTSLSFDGGSTAGDVTSFSLTSSWGVDEPNIIGSQTFATEPIDNTVLTVEGEATVILSDLTLYGSYDGSTDVDIQLSMDDGTHSMLVNMNKCRLTAAPWNMDGRERVLVTYSWKAYYDATGTENLQIVLTNDDATIP